MSKEKMNSDYIDKTIEKAKKLAKEMGYNSIEEGIEKLKKELGE